MSPLSAPQSRVAFSTNVSSTGWRSNVERLMTFRTSLVAVCCSRASVTSRLRAWSSWKRRTFSMAITAWSAKVLTSSICFSENGRTSVRRIAMAPMGTPSRKSGVTSSVRCPVICMRVLRCGNSVSATAAKSGEWRVSRVRGICSPKVRVVGIEPNRAASTRESPWTRNIRASAASQTRAAFSATAFMTGWRSDGGLGRGPLVFGVGRDVGDMDRPSLEGGSTHEGPSSGGDRVLLEELNPLLGGSPVVDRQAVHFAAEPEEPPSLCAAKPRCVLDQRLEHGLKIKRRAADHLEDFARGGLLLEGLGEVAVADLELLEEADGLDRDHGLLGKRLEERDLLFRKRLHVRPEDRNDAQRRLPSKERDGECRMVPVAVLELFPDWVLIV